MNYPRIEMEGLVTPSEIGPISTRIPSLAEIRAEITEIAGLLSQPGADVKKHTKRLDELAVLAAGLDPVCDNIANKRLFHNMLEGEVYKAHRKYPLTVLILDLDNFKGYNDTHGHLAGDDYLRKTASILRAGVKRSDIVGRVGGDEFGIAMPYTSLIRSLVVAGRLSKQVPNLSMGIAQLAPGEDANSLYKMADKTGLYTAKRQGRNMIGLVVTKEQNFSIDSIDSLHSYILNDPDINQDHKADLIEHTLTRTILIPAA